MSTFGLRLKKLREDKGIMNKDFAKIMKVEPATITNWEKGNRFPKEDVLIKIADYFNCSIDYLLGRTEDKNSIVYSGKYNNEVVEIEIHKDCPIKLSTKDIEKLIEELEYAGFDVNTLLS